MQVLYILLISIPTALSVVKRSDDVDNESLMTLVQQQAATIQAMQAQLTSLQTTVQQQSTIISDLSAKLSHTNTSLTDNIHNINSRIETKVSFTAHMHKTNVNIGTSNSPLKFEDVVTNIGGAYNPSSGVFTAPVSGVYVFYAQLMNDYQHGWMWWAIDKAGTVLCENDLDDNQVYDKSSCLATAHVQKGEQVFVRRNNGNPDQILFGAWGCSFAGYLLYVDAE